MYRGNSKIVPIALLVIVTIVAIIALVSIGRAILGGGQNQVADNSASKALLNTELDRSVRMTVRGPIVANENFRSYQVEISPIGRRMTTYKGYVGEVINVSRLTNTADAYTELVNALQRAGFTKTAELSQEANNTEGVCATGRLYTFELMRAQSVVETSWVSSCRNAPRSFRGEAVAVRSLLEAQIPNSRELMRDLNW